MPTAVQVSGLRSFPSTFLRHWKMKETNRRGNEAGQPENACRGVIETLPVGVIPYREAYLPVLCKMVVSKQLLCTVPTRAFKRVAWKSAKEIRNPKSLD